SSSATAIRRAPRSFSACRAARCSSASTSTASRARASGSAEIAQVEHERHNPTGSTALERRFVAARLLQSGRGRFFSMSRDYDDHDVSPRAIITHTSSGSPGRTTRTARLSPSMRSIARALVAEPSTPTTQVQAKGELALDGPEVHALAAHGTAGSGSSLPFLDQIQRAFGRHDVSGVKAHIGGPAAEAAQAMGARAYASGDRVA